MKKSKDSKIFYGWWVVLGSAILLAVLGPAAVAVANIYQAPIVADFGITNSQFALSNSLVLGVGIFLSPFISKQFTSGNFKRTYMVSLLIYAFAYIAYGFTTNIYLFYGLSLLVGYGYVSTTIIPVSILINNWFINKRGLALSLALTDLGVGGVVFSQLVTFLINTLDWRQAYMVYGGLMLLIVLPIMWFLIKVKPEDMNLQPYGVELDLNDQSGEEEQMKEVRMSFSDTMTKPFFIMLVVGAVLVGITNNGGLGQFPPVLTNLHGGATAATIISVYSAVGIVGKLVLGHVNDLYGIVKSTLYASFLLVIAYFLMLFSENIIAVFIMAVFFGMGNAIGTVLPPLITSAIYPAEQYSSAYGYVNSGVQLGMTVGSLFAAGIADLTGSYNYSWIAILIVAILVAVFWVGSYKNAKKYI
jgi:MFS family permease